MKKILKKKWLLYKILGVIIILFFVAFLRYCTAVQLFCSQNGSIFEITKVVFWAMLIYGLLEFLLPGFAEQDNIFFAKLTAIVAAPVLAAILLAILPNAFTMSIIAVLAAIVIATIAEILLARVQPNCPAILIVTLLFLILLVCFIVFTYYPLGGLLFRK